MIKQRTRYIDISYKKLDNRSDSDEETELFVRSKPQRIEFPSVERAIENGDTLQSLAIQYHCTIEELKRINNIHKENEIFARKTIKVPHRPFTSAVAGIHISGKSSPNESSVSSSTKSVDITSLNSKLSTNLNNQKESEVNEIIFNTTISPQEDKSRQPPTGVDDEHVRLLSLNRKFPSVESPRLNFNGADCDISWIALIICIVILIVAIPLIYVVYIAEHPELYQPNKSYQHSKS